MTLPTVAECGKRLKRIFAPTGDGRLSGLIAARAAFVALYVDAIGGSNPIRPMTVLWMCDVAAERQDMNDRVAWYAATIKSRKAVAALLNKWSADHKPWYDVGSREPLRDETFRGWLSYGAMQRDESRSTTSSKGTWSLDPTFAALLDPGLVDVDLDRAIAEWQEEHLGPVGRARAQITRQLAASPAAVLVQLPGGQTRELAAGGSSLILKGVIEIFAARALQQPAVLFISESRSQVDVVDGKLLAGLGLKVKADRLLPDALLFDAEPGLFWFVEVVFTDGAITAERKAEFVAWGEAQGIPAKRCSFLTAFLSRSAPPFRRLVSALAWDTFVWFLDEPDQLAWLEDLPARE